MITAEVYSHVCARCTFNIFFFRGDDYMKSWTSCDWSLYN